MMFNDQYNLTQAVLDGRKTITRRIVSPQPTYNDKNGINWKGYAYGIGLYEWEEPQKSYHNFTKNISLDKNFKGYKVGEVVAIAQRYKDIVCNSSFEDWEIKNLKNSKGWNNKMFVRADLMPHQIKITNISLQNLQDISDEDCLREGIYEHIILGSNRKVYAYNAIPPDYLAAEWFNTPREAFATLIDKISGKGTWERNPFVFVYEFKLSR